MSDNQGGEAAEQHDAAQEGYGTRKAVAEERAESSENLLRGLEDLDADVANYNAMEVDDVTATSEAADLNQRIAELMQMQESRTRERAELQERVASLETAAGRHRERGPDLSKILDKPAKFSGVEYNVKKFNDWLLKVE